MGIGVPFLNASGNGFNGEKTEPGRPAGEFGSIYQPIPLTAARTDGSATIQPARGRHGLLSTRANMPFPGHCALCNLSAIIADDPFALGVVIPGEAEARMSVKRVITTRASVLLDPKGV
ncbi:hypothetical protein [Ochrobactrum sp. CGA5]|uniref:hypothetical protein n=1 Tax=Ochrobactrum sp. CGA5 TaxID=2583453 RepID=UPI00111E4806|nr:hypothetical protein [Ochrobactrum sp. CGA5]